jgi:cell division protein FtsN
MSRPRNIPATRKRSSGGFLLGMFVGLFVGLTVSLMVAFYLNKTPIPFVTAKKPPEKNGAAKPAAIAGLPPGAAPAPAPEKPKFDFYKILPGQEEPVSDRELKSAAARQADKSGAPRDLYFVQAGAFQNPADADNLKARLALMGLQASVEPANLPDKGTWYRVRLGPYTQLDEINRVRQTLAQNAIDASLVKIKN